MAVLMAQFSPGVAETSMESAMASCRQEAMSTGLENEDDITNYIDLCMQAWHSPTEYTEATPAADTAEEAENPAGSGIEPGL
jgi:hypothetical protein